MLLAIDTSTVFTGVACYDVTGVLGECVWHSGRNHATQLLPQIDLLLQHLGRAPGDVMVVAVALGPGSWSGLRVGMSAAKGLALANDLPVIGIGTLDALYYQHYQPDVVVIPLLRLGRDRFATASFVAHGPAARTNEPRNVTFDEIAAPLAAPTLFCGDLDDEIVAALQRAHGEQARFPSPAQRVRRPAVLAELAWQRWERGDVDDVGTLEPIYLGQPVKLRDA